MKNLMIPALALFLSAAAQADDSPLWMRYCAISPDGQTIAFLTKGISTRSLLPEEKPGS
jgi:tricorn protease